MDGDNSSHKCPGLDLELSLGSFFILEQFTECLREIIQECMGSHVCFLYLLNDCNSGYIIK